MMYRNNTGLLGCWLHECVLRNTLAGQRGSKCVVFYVPERPCRPCGPFEKYLLALARYQNHGHVMFAISAYRRKHVVERGLVHKPDPFRYEYVATQQRMPARIPWSML